MQAPPPSRLILVGASCRYMAESAARTGLRVTAIDAFGDQDLREACEGWLPLGSPGDLLNQLARLPPASVILLGGAERWSAVIPQISEFHDLLGPSLGQWKQLRDRTWILPWARQAGIRLPEQRPTQPANLGGWLKKLKNSTGGLSVRRASFADPSHSMNTSDDAVYEKMIPGRSFGISFLATRSQTHLIGIAASLRSRRSPLPFIYEGSIGPIQLSDELTQKLGRLGRLIAEESNLLGLFGIDVMIDPQQNAWLLEINPRPTASLELFDHNDVSLLKQHIDACQGRDVSPLPPTSPEIFAKRILYAQSPVHFDLQAMQNLVGQHIQLADIPTHRSTIPAGSPICSLIARGDSHVQVCQQLAFSAGRFCMHQELNPNA